MAHAQKRKTSPTKTAPAPSPPLTFENLLVQHHEAPAWIAEMHRYYAEHGCYRAADLDRLLGRPGVYTEGRAITDFVGNGTHKK